MALTRDGYAAQAAYPRAREVSPPNRFAIESPGVSMRAMEPEDRSVKEVVADVRARVERRTFIQDVTEPLTGRTSPCTKQGDPSNRLAVELEGVRAFEMSEHGDERSVKEILHEVRQRVERRTFIQDVSEPLTGRIDQRKIAAKFNNLEHAVDELADAVERVAEEKSA